MSEDLAAGRPVRTARTLLEQLIRQRRQSFEEFVVFAERYARKNREAGLEAGTLSVRHLQRLAAGRRSDGGPLGQVRPATARLLEGIFGVGVEELLSSPASQSAAGGRAVPTAGPSAADAPTAVTGDRAPGVPGSVELPWLEWSEEEEQREAMERRRLLQWAATSVGAGALVSAEPVRRLFDAVLAGEQRSVEDWEVTCADHLHACRTRPPAQVRDDLVVDLVALQHQLAADSAPATERLSRIVAMLALLHAAVLTGGLGEHGPAIRWWRTARHAADVSGDLHLRVLTRCEEAGFGLYGQRDLQTVLHLTCVARQIAGATPSARLADLVATEAKALALLGRHQEARRALNTLTDLAAADLTEPGPNFWVSDQVHFAESWVYSSAGDQAAAARAAEFVLGSSTSDYIWRANVMLHQAMCTIVNGGTEPGVQQAIGVLNGVPAPYRSNMITETGRMVLRAVPPGHREQPAVTELREALAIAPPRRPAGPDEAEQWPG